MYGRDVVVLPEKLGKFREGDGVVFQVKVEAGATKRRDQVLMAVPNCWEFMAMAMAMVSFIFHMARYG